MANLIKEVYYGIKCVADAISILQYGIGEEERERAAEKMAEAFTLVGVGVLMAILTRSAAKIRPRGRVVPEDAPSSFVEKVKAAREKVAAKLKDNQGSIRPYQVGEEVIIPRSNGGISTATIFSIDKNGIADVRWTENGRPLKKNVPISRLRRPDLDDLNPSYDWRNSPGGKQSMEFNSSHRIGPGEQIRDGVSI